MSQHKVIYGIKSGVGVWQFMSLKGNPNSGAPLKRSYPLGISFGFYVENILSDNFSLINELTYEYTKAEINIYTGIEGQLNQRVTSQFLDIPVLLKYRTPALWNTYCLIGPGIAILLDANYSYYDHIYSFYKGEVNITKELPTVNIFINIGIGKEFGLLKSNLIIELVGKIGINKNQYKGNLIYYDIGEWKNVGAFILVGLRLR
ncbi:MULTISPECIES: outer membrane beta-barrel protein [Melioribacter]|nr:outer membrane beta-barrel protein [Melioribacter roseus]